MQCDKLGTCAPCWVIDTRCSGYMGGNCACPSNLCSLIYERPAEKGQEYSTWEASEKLWRPLGTGGCRQRIPVSLPSLSEFSPAPAAFIFEMPRGGLPMIVNSAFDLFFSSQYRPTKIIPPTKPINPIHLFLRRDSFQINAIGTRSYSIADCHILHPHAV